MANTNSKTKKSSTTTKSKTTKNANNTKSTVKRSNATNNKVSAKKVVEVSQEKESNMILTVIGIIILVIVAVVIFRLTYAFFTANIVDQNKDNTDVVVQTADLLVRYIDDSKIVESKISPGDKVEKEFSVRNEGGDTGYYSIVLDNFENTFSVVCPTEDEPNNGELAFQLLSIDEDLNESVISTGTLPCVTPALGEDNPLILYTHASVKVGKTRNYKLVIEYKNLVDIDQSDNMDDGKLTARINIIQSEDEQRTQFGEYSN